MKAKIDKLKKKFGVGKGEESQPKEKVISEDCGFSQTTFEFFNKDNNKRIGVLTTSEKAKKEQFVDIKAFLDTIVFDKKLANVDSFVIIKITNQFPLPLNDNEIDKIIYNGIVKDFEL